MEDTKHQPLASKWGTYSHWENEQTSWPLFSSVDKATKSNTNIIMGIVAALLGGFYNRFAELVFLEC